jgi:hypothetical protein
MRFIVDKDNANAIVAICHRYSKIVGGKDRGSFYIDRFLDAHYVYMLLKRDFFAESGVYAFIMQNRYVDALQRNIRLELSSIHNIYISSYCTR